MLLTMRRDRVGILKSNDEGVLVNLLAVKIDRVMSTMVHFSK